MVNITEVEDKDQMDIMNIMVKSKMEDLGQKVMMDGDSRIEIIKYIEDNHLVEN